VARYSEPDLSIDFDNFVSCLIRLEILFGESGRSIRSIRATVVRTSVHHRAQSRDKDGGDLSVHFDATLFATVTFETLDKDHVGKVELNTLEVSGSQRGEEEDDDDHTQV